MPFTSFEYYMKKILHCWLIKGYHKSLISTFETSNKINRWFQLSFWFLQELFTLMVQLPNKAVLNEKERSQINTNNLFHIEKNSHIKND